MSGHETGFYWVYSLDRAGHPCEEKGSPFMCYYSREDNTISFVKCDESLPYSENEYMLVKKAKYEPVVKCIGRDGDSPCGLVGGRDGETCGQCGGMLLNTELLIF